MDLRFAAASLLALALSPPDAAHALMNLRPGDAPPPFSLADLAGRQVESGSLAGAPAVVVFWSTWSPRSAEALADLGRLAAEHGERGLRIVAVNIDGERLGSAQRAAVREYAAARALAFPVLLDEGLAVFSAWGVMAHPTEVVLDAGGRIAYVLPGYPPSLREELEEEVRRVLGVGPARPQAPPAPVPAAGVAPQGMALQHYNLGLRLLAKGDSDKALGAFRRAAAADPGFLDAALMVARLALAAGSLAEAEQLAGQVSPEAVNRGDLGSLLGSLALAQGRLDAAERAFRDLQERLPAEGWGSWGLGQTALARGDAAAALGLLTQARALRPEHPEGEAFVKRHLRARWQRRESVPGEDGFVALFPALGELRERYRRLFNASGAAPAGGP